MSAPAGAAARTRPAVGVADGLRALSVALVVWFHFWQQDWLRPLLRLPFALPGGARSIDFSFLPRTGYLFVDFLLLLSGFCLFLPTAQAMAEGRPDAGRIAPGPFYRRRAARILPGYYFCLLVILLTDVLPRWDETSAGHFWLDLLSHLTLTQTFFAPAYQATRFNGVLWTLAIEAQFYLLFPLLCRLFARAPRRCFAALQGVSLASAAALLAADSDLYLWVNQLPLLLGVYADGMLAAVVLARLRQRPPRAARTAACTALALASLAGILRLLRLQSATVRVQRSQLLLRLPLGLLFALLLVSLALAARPLRRLFDNRAARFFAGISYGLYLWHQYLAVQLKYRWHLPAWSGQLPPNQTGDLLWQRRYALLITAAALAAALFSTYCIERPLGRRILAGRGAPGK